MRELLSLIKDLHDQLEDLIFYLVFLAIQEVNQKRRENIQLEIRAATLNLEEK